jgi:transcriptional regulator with XRE-family HTH domain
VQLCGEEDGMVSTRRVSSDDGEIAQRIRLVRAASGVTQRGLARALAVSVQQITKYEQGGNRVSGGQLVSIARTLKVPVSRLTGEDGEVAAVPSARAVTKLIRNFCALDADIQEVVIKVVGMLASSQTRKSQRPRRVAH